MDRTFTWFPKLTRVLSDVPDGEGRAALALALIEYGTYGAEPDLQWPLSALFEAVRDDIDNSVKARNDNKGGRPRKGNGRKSEKKEPESEEAETRVSETENGGFETENGGFGHGEKEETHTNISHTNISQDKEEPPYPLACLAAFNEEMGTAYGSLPPKVALHLNAMEGRYQVDDVRAMVAYKRDEWRGTRFANCLTPNTLFGQDHFEQYMHQAKDEGKRREDFDAEFGELAKAF